MLLFNSQSASRIERLQESNLCGNRQLSDKSTQRSILISRDRVDIDAADAVKVALFWVVFKSQWDILTTDMDNLIKLTSCWTSCLHRAHNDSYIRWNIFQIFLKIIDLACLKEYVWDFDSMRLKYYQPSIQDIVTFCNQKHYLRLKQVLNIFSYTSSIENGCRVGTVWRHACELTWFPDAS